MRRSRSSGPCISSTPIWMKRTAIRMNTISVMTCSSHRSWIRAASGASIFLRVSWVDYFSGATHTGPAVMQVKCSLETFPLFVRSGSIIPGQPDMEYTDQRPAGFSHRGCVCLRELPVLAL